MVLKPLISARAAAIAAFILTMAVCAHAVEPSRPRLAVVDFTHGGTSENAWVGKALSDLLIRTLSESPDVIILDRESMQTFSKEALLGESGLADTEKALRVGRLGKAEDVLYGSYQIQGSRLSVQVRVLDLALERMVFEVSAEGDLNELPAVVRRLANDVLLKQHVESPKKPVLSDHRFTDSVSAAKHFYQGLDAYDRGEYADAFGDFFASSRQDPRFLEAGLWSARMLEYLGQDDQALLSYRELFRKNSAASEGVDALLFSAKLLETRLGRPEEAITAYALIAARRPMTPQVIEALYRLGERYEIKGQILEAFTALNELDLFLESIARGEIQRIGEPSRFFGWEREMDLAEDVNPRLIALYGRLLSLMDPKNLPKPPRGLFLTTLEKPWAGEGKFNTKPSIYFKKRLYPNWNEEYYVVAAPKGYLATGAVLTVTGRVTQSSPAYAFLAAIHRFPLQRGRKPVSDIFGQTRDWTTLKKTVHFHGQDEALIALRFCENFSEIRSWRLDLTLKPETAAQPVPPPAPEKADENFWEGKPVGMISFPVGSLFSGTRPAAEDYYFPKKEIAVAAGTSHQITMVATSGELDGSETDLWFSEGQEGRPWSAPERLELNSPSHDYYPKLLFSESGALVLSWLSTRRGKGWEIWTALRDKSGKWTQSSRIPLEAFFENLPKGENHQMLPEYDFFQNSRGEWIAAVSWRDRSEVVILRSRDRIAWEVLARIAVPMPLYGLSLAEDVSGIWRLSALTVSRELFLLRSSDGKEWVIQRRPTALPPGDYATPAVHATRIFPEKDGSATLLVSDNTFGLQSARFFPDTDTPEFNLVSWAELQPYAAARLKEDFIVALKSAEGAVIRRYKTFNSTGVAAKKDSPAWPIYEEKESASDGRVWTRFSARPRNRVSDVTALGIAEGGRIWWGIESGVMSKKADDFFATDVSQGFIHHYVTSIACCGPSVWFSSREAMPAFLGFLPRWSNHPRFSDRRLPVKGSVTAIVCGLGDGVLWAGTSEGEVVRVDQGRIGEPLKTGSTSVQALAVSPDGVLWAAGTTGIFKLKGTAFEVLAGTETWDVRALAIDRSGALWAAPRGLGLARLSSGAWQLFSASSSNLSYDSIGFLAADKESGVWYLPDQESRSVGLGYFDGQAERIHNPPHRLIRHHSSLAVDQEGAVWVGTLDEGLFRMEPRI